MPSPYAETPSSPSAPPNTPRPHSDGHRRSSTSTAATSCPASTTPTHTSPHWARPCHHSRLTCDTPAHAPSTTPSPVWRNRHNTTTRRDGSGVTAGVPPHYEDVATPPDVCPPATSWTTWHHTPRSFSRTTRCTPTGSTARHCA